MVLDWEGLEAADVVVVDTETSGLHADDGARVACVSVRWDGGVMSLPFSQGPTWLKAEDSRLTPKQRAIVAELAEEYDDPSLSWEVWRRLLMELREKKLVYHNAKFDMWMMLVGTDLWRGGNLAPALRWDTMLAARVIEPTESASLDATAKRIGLDGKEGIDEVKAWLKEHKLPCAKTNMRLDLAPWDLVKVYVDGDTELTWAVYEDQMNYLNGEEVAEDLTDWISDIEDRSREGAEINRELDLCRTLFAMEVRGLGFDVEKSLTEADRLLARADEIEAGMPFKCDITSAKRWFFDEKGMDPPKLTMMGKPSLDNETIRDWGVEGVEWASEYSEVSRARRGVSMWYRGYPAKIGADGRLRSDFKQSFTASGRLSAGRINLQALPKADKMAKGQLGVKDLLVAKPGYGLWSLDLQQAELRAATRYAGCEKMAELLRDGDAHALTTHEVLQVPYEAPDFRYKRDIGKQANFSCLFGIGGPGFQSLLSRQAGIHLSVQECTQIVRGWRELYPEFTWAYRRAERAFQERGYVRILPGTEYESRSYLGPRDWPRTGWNRMVQGSLAAWLRLWLVAVEKRWPGSLVLTVHDSIVLELPLSEGWGISQQVAQWSTERASELFDCDMGVDIDPYTDEARAASCVGSVG